MANNTKTSTKGSGKIKPALSAEAEENQNIALANNLAQEMLRNGTATSQIILHFLKQGSQKEKLERERLEKENELLKAKTEELKATKRTEELMEEALSALTVYKGNLHGAESYDEEPL